VHLKAHTFQVLSERKIKLAIHQAPTALYFCVLCQAHISLRFNSSVSAPLESAINQKGLWEAGRHVLCSRTAMWRRLVHLLTAHPQRMLARAILSLNSPVAAEIDTAAFAYGNATSIKNRHLNFCPLVVRQEFIR